MKLRVTNLWKRSNKGAYHIGILVFTVKPTWNDGAVAITILGFMINLTWNYAPCDITEDGGVMDIKPWDKPPKSASKR